MVAIMALLALVFMYPVFEGKVLYQNDIVQAKNMSAEADQFEEETGEYTAWTNSAFSGMPTYQIKGVPGNNVFKAIFRAIKIYLPGYSAAILFACLLMFYFLLRTLKIERLLALAGAIAFGLGAHHLQLIGAGHVSKIYAIAYIAPVIAGVLLVFKRHYLIGGLITAIGFGIQLVTNHVQVSYYTGIILLVYILVELVYAIKDKYFNHLIKSGATLLVALLLAILPNMTNLLTTYEYTHETTRGQSELVKEGPQTRGLDLDYITQWSYGIGETMNLFIPNLYGGGGTVLGEDSESYKMLKNNNITDPNAWRYIQSQSYWGGQPFTSGPHYVGAVTIFLAILGLMLIRGKKRWWLAIVIVMSIMLSWGSNFMGLTRFFVEYVPMFSKFRDATNSLIIAQFAIPLLAFLAAREWFSPELEPEVKKKKLLVASGVAGGIALLYALIPTIAGTFTGAGDSAIPEWLQESLQSDRIGLARRDAFRTLLFVLIGAGILWISLKSRIKREYLYLALALVVLVDMGIVSTRYFSYDDFMAKRQFTDATKPWPADENILKDNTYHARVLDLTADPFRSARASAFHQSIGGYHGAKLGRYQDLIDRYLASYVGEIRQTLQGQVSYDAIVKTLSTMGPLHMLNTHYLIFSPQSPLKNEEAQGNAWFADRIVWAQNANEELEAIGTVNLKLEAVVDERFRNQVEHLPLEMTPSAESDHIELTEYQPNHLKYEVKASQDRLALFSEIFYPKGWKSYIDGKEVDHFRANYLLRAMVIPSGSHTIEFHFDPPSLRIGRIISLIGSVLVLLVIGGIVFLEVRKKLKPTLS